MRRHLPQPRLPAPVGLALLVIGMALFGLLAADLMRFGPITRADGHISEWFHVHMHPMFTTVLLAITQWHSTAGIGVMALAAAGVLVYLRERLWLAALVLCVPGGMLLNVAIKQAFQRARPSLDHPLLTLQSYSFPSGHTAGATVWWGFVLMLCLSWLPERRWRVAAVVAVVLLIGLTALSRLYLGVHYLTDVLAAIAEAAAWVVLVFTALGGYAGTLLTRAGVERHA